MKYKSILRIQANIEEKQKDWKWLGSLLRTVERFSRDRRWGGRWETRQGSFYDSHSHETSCTVKTGLRSIHNCSLQRLLVSDWHDQSQVVLFMAWKLQELAQWLESWAYKPGVLNVLLARA